MQPPAEPADLSPQSHAVAPVSTQVRWSDAISGTLLAGFLLAVALNFPYAMPFLLMASAGGLAAAMYQHRSGQPMTPGMGARVGVVGGAIGFIIMVALLAVEVAVGHGRLIASLRQALAEQLARNPNPQAQQVMQQLMTPGGLAVVVGFLLLFFLAVVVICSAIGGALGASLFGRRKQ